MVAVAQLVESRIVIPVVAGSSPVSHPKFNELGARLPGFYNLYCIEYYKKSPHRPDFYGHTLIHWVCDRRACMIEQILGTCRR